jgi:hypothetical protein
MRLPGRATHRGRAARQLRLGRWLALLALSLRLVAPFLPAPASPADAAELVRLFGPHALCLSQESGEPGSGTADRPGSGPGSDEADHRFGTCCFWHCSAGLGTPPPLAVAPIVFPSSVMSFPTAASAVVATRHPGIARARAPPREA